jgi:flagellar basal body-associated protein FliL
MSEETNDGTNDGTMSGLKKAIIAAITTAITAGGGYFVTQLFGGGEDEAPKTEQVAPVQAAPITINVQQNQENKQKVDNGGGTKVIERVIERPAPQSEAPKKKEEEDSW